MRKHNRNFAQRWGSARVDGTAPSIAHSITNNKQFQLACNSVLSGLLKRLK